MFYFKNFPGWERALRVGPGAALVIYLELRVGVQARARPSKGPAFSGVWVRLNREGVTYTTSAAIG